MWLIRLVLILALALPPVGAILYAQEAGQPTPENGPEFFSGIVTDVNEDHVTVSRAVLGKPAELRSFVLNSETKVDGKLKARVRVTVGFKTTESGDVALRIVVRNGTRK